MNARSRHSSALERKALALTPVLALSIGIFVASSIPSMPTPSLGIDWQDKIFHATAFFVYGLFLQFAVFGCSISISTRRALAYVLLIGIAYGISDEIHQSFVPSRMAEAADAMADAVGVALSTALLGTTRRFLLRLGWR